METLFDCHSDSNDIMPRTLLLHAAFSLKSPRWYAPPDLRARGETTK